MGQHFNLIAWAKPWQPRRFALLVVEREPDLALRGESREAILDALHREFNLFTDAFGNGSLGTGTCDPARFVQVEASVAVSMLRWWGA
jgi:hypothetical protein